MINEAIVINKSNVKGLTAAQKSNRKRMALLLGGVLCAVLLKRDSRQASSQDRPKSKK